MTNTEITLILEGDAFSNFIDSLKADSTKQAYRDALKIIMKFTQSATPGELLHGDTKLLQQQLISFVKDQRQKGLSTKVIQLRLSAAKHFYDMNDVILNWKKIASFIGETTLKHEDRPYTREEIKTILLTCKNIRDRMIILLLATTGIRIGACTTIQNKHLKRIEKYQIYQITVYPRTNDEYITFCTPECAKLIDLWTESRRNAGEKISPQSFLLIPDYNKKEGSIEAEYPRKLSTQSIDSMLFHRVRSTSIRPIKAAVEGEPIGKRRYEVKLAHGFRKFFDTTLTNAGVSPTFSELLMGHKLPGTKSHYYRTTPEQLLEGTGALKGYVTAIDALTINDESRLSQQLKEANEKINDIASLKLEVSKLKKWLFEKMDEQMKTQHQTSFHPDLVYDYDKWLTRNMTPEQIKLFHEKGIEPTG